MSFTELKHQQNAVELTDSDYPPVYGEPVLERPETKPTSDEGVKNDSLTEQGDSTISLVKEKDVYQILKKEGFNVSDEDIKFLNIFPSPMDAFQYGLYSFGITDVYIVVMVNIRQKTVYGYHVLDLTQNNSLVDDLINRLKNKDFIV